MILLLILWLVGAIHSFRRIHPCFLTLPQIKYTFPLSVQRTQVKAVKPDHYMTWICISDLSHYLEALWNKNVAWKIFPVQGTYRQKCHLQLHCASEPRNSFQWLKQGESIFKHKIGHLRTATYKWYTSVNGCSSFPFYLWAKIWIIEKRHILCKCLEF